MRSQVRGEVRVNAFDEAREAGVLEASCSGFQLAQECLRLRRQARRRTRDEKVADLTRLAPVGERRDEARAVQVPAVAAPGARNPVEK